MPEWHKLRAVDVHLRDLRFFLALAEELHFTRAADALHISQPVMSKRLAILEGQLGVKLLERDRRSVRLTPAGDVFAQSAATVVAAWVAAEQELAAASRGRVTIGLQTSPGGGVLPRMRALMAERCPELELVLRQVGWQDATAGLQDRTSDAAFLWLPLPRPSRFRWLTVAREPIFVALASGHRFAHRDRLDLTELLDEPFLALPATDSPMRDFWLATEHRGGRAPVIAAEISDTEETYEAISSGIGICLLAERNIPIYDRGGTVCVPLPDLPAAEFVLAWRRDDTAPRRRTIVEACREALAHDGHDDRVERPSRRQGIRAR